MLTLDSCHAQALVVGPDETPYANGIFVFDISLPADYPHAPPAVHLLTTGGGRVRFNPNLYNCGKVCLSLLGTWQGPGWDPQRSTLLEVLMAIQGQILVPDPFFNEPGFEAMRRQPAGRAQAEAYAAQARDRGQNHNQDQDQSQNQNRTVRRRRTPRRRCGPTRWRTRCCRRCGRRRPRSRGFWPPTSG